MYSRRRVIQSFRDYQGIGRGHLGRVHRHLGGRGWRRSYRGYVVRYGRVLPRAVPQRPDIEACRTNCGRSGLRDGSHWIRGRRCGRKCRRPVMRGIGARARRRRERSIAGWESELLLQFLPPLPDRFRGSHIHDRVWLPRQIFMGSTGNHKSGRQEVVILKAMVSLLTSWVSLGEAKITHVLRVRRENVMRPVGFSHFGGQI
jgi:hypothetical protein